MLNAVLMLLVCGYSFISLDSGCSSKVTTGNIVRLFVEDKVDAFIGPPCSSGLPPQLLTAFISKTMQQLDGYIVWNADNAIFGSKRSAVCATKWAWPIDVIRPRPLRPSAFCGEPSTRVRRRRKFGVCCTECTGQENDFELIPTVKVETQTSCRGQGHRFSYQSKAHMQLPISD